MPLPPIVITGPFFREEANRPWSQKALVHLLDAITAINVDWLKLYPNTPSIYQAGVRYRAETDEKWKIIPQIISDGEGDCEDLACWRAAEMRVKGIEAMPFLTYRKLKDPNGNPFYLYHVITVARIGGKWHRFDPSRRLGMGS